MERNKRDDLLVIFLGIILAYLMYLIVLSELSRTLSDYNGHTYIYLPLFKRDSWIEGWKAVPYCMWHLSVLGLNRLLHIPLETSAAYVSSLSQLFAYFVIYWMLRRFTEAKGVALGAGRAAGIAFGLSVAQALYFDWLDTGDRFVGTFSINPVHNPTHMCMRPFALICFCLVCDIWGKQKDEGYKGIFFQVERGLKGYYIYLAAALFLSSMAKPVFAEMFIPAVGLVMLVEWFVRIRRKDGSGSAYFQHCLTTLLCAVPSLVYILLQFLAYFFWGGSYEADGSFMVTKWMEVWRLYTENVTLSIVLGMAFPLFLVLIDGGFFVREDMGRLALTGYAVGLLEAASLGEGGEKLSHGDFLWPMMCGMLLMWMTAMMRLLVLERTQTDSKGKRALVNVAWALFCIHVLCGLLYFKELIGI